MMSTDMVEKYLPLWLLKKEMKTWRLWLMRGPFEDTKPDAWFAAGGCIQAMS